LAIRENRNPPEQDAGELHIYVRNIQFASLAATPICSKLKHPYY